jgi:hypothetical protein
LLPVEFGRMRAFCRSAKAGKESARPHRIAA